MLTWLIARVHKWQSQQKLRKKLANVERELLHAESHEYPYLALFLLHEKQALCYQLTELDER